MRIQCSSTVPKIRIENVKAAADLERKLLKDEDEFKGKQERERREFEQRLEREREEFKVEITKSEITVHRVSPSFC